MNYKRKIIIEINTPIAKEDAESLEKAIKAVVGIIIVPECYTVESFITP